MAWCGMGQVIQFPGTVIKRKKRNEQKLIEVIPAISFSIPATHGNEAKAIDELVAELKKRLDGMMYECETTLWQDCDCFPDKPNA